MGTALLLAVGCRSSEPAAAPTAPTPPAAAAAPTPPASGGAQSALADGKHFGSLSSIQDDRLGFDDAELLTGDAADQAARAAGELAADAHVDNDYYIRNRTTELVTLPLAAEVQVRLLPRSGPPDFTSGTQAEPAPLAKLLRYFRGNDADATSIRSARYWVTVTGGKVTQLEEVYFP
jgi:hypothetical protein